MILKEKADRKQPKFIYIYFLILSVLILANGCDLDSISREGQANAGLAEIPKVTAVPTKVRPTATPIAEYVQADALAIATEVALNRINNPPTPTVEPTIQVFDVGSAEPPNVAYPLMEDGANFREIPGGIWYTSQASAAEAQEYLIDRFTYLRWDKHKVGDTGEGYGQVQFEKNFIEFQVNIWENKGLDHTAITVVEVKPALEFVREMESTTYDSRWIVMGEDEEELANIEKSYDVEMPLPMVRLFYVVRMLDAGWQLIPTDRLDTYAVDVQFFREDDQVAILLQDNGFGTTVTFVER